MVFISTLSLKLPFLFHKFPFFSRKFWKKNLAGLASFKGYLIFVLKVNYYFPRVKKEIMEPVPRIQAIYWNNIKFQPSLPPPSHKCIYSTFTLVFFFFKSMNLAFIHRLNNALFVIHEIMRLCNFGSIKVWNIGNYKGY